MATTKELLEEYEKKRKKIAETAPDALKNGTRAVSGQPENALNISLIKALSPKSGVFVTHRTTAFGLDKKEIPADGIVTGFGKVNGRYVVAAAEDYLAMAGTFGEQHGKKLAYAVDFAKDKAGRSSA
jgi:acetyl-CoA carboxylase carboxyltransferase component